MMQTFFLLQMFRLLSKHVFILKEINSDTIVAVQESQQGYYGTSEMEPGIKF